MLLNKEKYIQLTHDAHKYAKAAYGSRTNGFDISYKAYMAAGQAEAERAQKLVEVLEKLNKEPDKVWNRGNTVLDSDKKRITAAQKECATALSEYHHPETKS